MNEIADGSLKPVGREEALMPGDIDEVSPTIGDIHIVKNAFADKTSISYSCVRWQYWWCEASRLRP